MTRKHMALVALGLAALAGLVLLWRASRPGEHRDLGDVDPGAVVENATSSGAAGETTSRGRTRRPQLTAPEVGAESPAPGTTPRQLAPAAARDDAGAQPPGPRVYVRDDGVLVRDHRTRPGARPMTTRPVARPQRTASRVQPSTVLAVRGAMRPIVHRCQAEVAAASIGAQPRVESDVLISIASATLTVDDVSITTHDLEEPAASALRDCVVQGVKKIELSVPGSVDVAGHALRLPFRLRQ